MDRIFACTPLFALLHFVKHACTCRLRAMRERDSWLAESTARSFLLFKQQCRNSPCVSQPLTQHTTRVNYRSHRSSLPIPPRGKKNCLSFFMSLHKKKVTHVHDQSLVTWATCFFGYLVPIVLVGTFRCDRLFGVVSFVSKTTF